MKINITERILHFKQPAGTSRGVYTERKIWLVEMKEGERKGIGECAPLPQLSCDDIPNYPETLRLFCDKIEQTGVIDYQALRPYPSMLFGLESASTQLHVNGSAKLFDTPFGRGEEGIKRTVFILLCSVSNNFFVVVKIFKNLKTSFVV